MGPNGRARRVRIYLNQGDHAGSKPVLRALLELLQAHAAQGATVFGGVEGFGASGELHGEHLLDVGRRLPVVLEWIDEAELVAQLLGELARLAPGALITVEDTEVVLERPRSVRDVPSLLRVGEVMSKTVSAVAPAAPLREVVELMLGGSYRSVPVVEGGAPVGIVTNTDLVRRGGLAARLELLGRLDEPERTASLAQLEAQGKVAADVMTPRPATISAAAPLREAAAIMVRRRLKRLPVVDERGALVGMVSRVDLLRAAAGEASAAEPAARDLGADAAGPISGIMRTDVPMVHPETPLPVVLQAVMATGLNRALVVDADGRPVGLVTDAEVLDRLTPAVRPGVLRALMHRLPLAHPAPEVREAEQHARARTARELMTGALAVVVEETPIAAAIEEMLRGSHKVLAVTSREGRLLGIVDRADLLHGLVAGVHGA